MLDKLHLHAERATYLYIGSPVNRREPATTGRKPMTGKIATAAVDIAAAPQRVWKALTDPDEIETYMFGSRVETDWQPGSPIVWRGEYEGRRFEDKGKVLEVEPAQRLTVTHFSPLSGQP